MRQPRNSALSCSTWARLVTAILACWLPCVIGAAEDKPLGPLDVVRQFVVFVEKSLALEERAAQGGETAPEVDTEAMPKSSAALLRAAAKWIEPSDATNVWANRQLDSMDQRLVERMRVYSLFVMLRKDPVVGQPQFVRQAVRGGEALNPDLEQTMLRSTSEIVTEVQATHAVLKLKSGRSLVLNKGADKHWRIAEYSGSLLARADWVGRRNRELEIPAPEKFKEYRLNLAGRKPQHAWDVVLALGEAGRFEDIGALIQLKEPAKAQEAVPVVDERTEHGRQLYSWIRRSRLASTRLRASTIDFPDEWADGKNAWLNNNGKLADVVLVSHDQKEIVLKAKKEVYKAPFDPTLRRVEYFWEFDCDCYSPETKREWVRRISQGIFNEK